MIFSTENSTTDEVPNDMLRFRFIYSSKQIKKLEKKISKR